MALANLFITSVTCFKVFVISQNRYLSLSLSHTHTQVGLCHPDAGEDLSHPEHFWHPGTLREDAGAREWQVYAEMHKTHHMSEETIDAMARYLYCKLRDYA